MVSRNNIEEAKAEFSDLQFKVQPGHRYLGGFIGEKDAFDEWIQEKVEDWMKGVIELASVAKAYPQSAYAALQRSLQQQWQFLQRVQKDTGEKFQSVTDAISDTFLPALFGDTIDKNDPRDCRVDLACLPVKHAGLALPNPVKSAESNYQASVLASLHLCAAMRGVEEFESA